MYIHRQCVGRTYSDGNPGPPRKIMCIIVQIMRIIVLEFSIRLLSIHYARVPVDTVELAFFIDIQVDCPVVGEGTFVVQY